MIGSDGSYAETRGYSLYSKGEGFIVQTEYLNNNGQNNCQGLSATYVRENTINEFFVELNGGEMKLYFSNRPSQNYFILKRQP